MVNHFNANLYRRNLHNDNNAYVYSLAIGIIVCIGSNWVMVRNWPYANFAAYWQVTSAFRIFFGV